LKGYLRLEIRDTGNGYVVVEYASTRIDLKLGRLEYVERDEPILDI